MASTTPRWCTRKTLYGLLGYPFIQLKVRRITICTEKRNKKLRKLVAGVGSKKGLGFKLEGNLRRGYPTDDCLIYGMLKEEAIKWITKKSSIDGS